MRAGLVTYLVVVHVAAILLFSRGFLLSRLALSDVSKPNPNAQEWPQQTHKRAVVLIIDSLRFDFITPSPPEPQNAYHHNVLTLPAELTKTRPEHSFMFNAYADPPTTTLQRIKALTTGSLPTFVDMGSNFGGSAILEDSIVKQLQLVNATIAFMGDDTWLSVYPTSFNPNLTFPYDSFNVEDLHTVDTGVLTHLFPLLLNSHPGLPLNTTSTGAKQFDFLIGHFLGVDHVGHRVGPSHLSMRAKLTQMDTALRRVVDLLNDDTLLVVLGDHGMDRAGDHGGDGILETSSALWIYSKGLPLMDRTLPKVFSGLLGYKTFPGGSKPWRSVQQIDLLPTLSLLLGLPIPYNNLGSIIPELFWRSSPTRKSELEIALTANSQQIHQYLNTYRSSSSGSELNSAWTSLESAWDAISVAPQLSPTNPIEAKLVAMSSFNRSALAACRAIWAQFNPILMAAGLALMLAGIFTTFIVYNVLRSRSPTAAEELLHDVVPKVLKTTMMADTAVAGASKVLGFALPIIFPNGLPMTTLETGLFIGPMVGCVVLSVSALVYGESGPSQRGGSRFGVPAALGLLILALHTASFFSNSFTFWEDRIVLWLCATSMVPFILWGAAAPGLSSSSSTNAKTPASTTSGQKKKITSLQERLGLTTLRGKILGFTLLFLVCIRLMSLVTVCREEQGAYCHVTFYATPPPASAPVTPLDLGINTTAAGETVVAPEPMAIVHTSTTPPNWSLILALPTAFILPAVITRILKITKSDNGIAPIIVWGVVTPALVCSWAFWTLEWVESGGLYGADGPFLKTIEVVVGALGGVVGLRTLRSWIARGAVSWVMLGTAGWWLLPLCLDIRVTAPSPTLALSTSASSATAPRKTQVTILGYANAYGASYLMFYLLMFSSVYLCTPLPGQVVLGLASIALMAYLEALDGVRDAKEIERVVGRALNPSQISTDTRSGTVTATKKPQADSGVTSKDVNQLEAEMEPITFLTTIPLILLSFITFYATGHQSTVSSMQWKTGFVLTESVRYPWSVLSVVLNTAGPFLLLGIAGAALNSGWKRSPMPSPPLPSNASRVKDGDESSAEPGSKPEEQEVAFGQDVEHSSLLTILLIQLYFLMLLFGTSMSAAVLRRHLMVWKVFAPRYMAAVVEMGVVDLGVLLSVCFVVGRVVDKVGWVLGRVGIRRSLSESSEREKRE
ncbi:hypothetical protein D9756_009050 [Leucocoprinus leucothites]|uniref:GPI ethanolamine phosphate transferase 2 C-terminal domain-containing protein n=1 Tax=Leucocoprinus leucothites TaxID=201217 RepID=A0A8H5FUA2_9AGAR|nr:hypothetical protein D9756_009050 [Leucoagaricus leucothites]